MILFQKNIEQDIYYYEKKPISFVTHKHFKLVLNSFYSFLRLISI